MRDSLLELGRVPFSSRFFTSCPKSLLSSIHIILSNACILIILTRNSQCGRAYGRSFLSRGRVVFWKDNYPRPQVKCAKVCIGRSQALCLVVPNGGFLQKVGMRFTYKANFLVLLVRVYKISNYFVPKVPACSCSLRRAYLGNGNLNGLVCKNADEN